MILFAGVACIAVLLYFHVFSSNKAIPVSPSVPGPVVNVNVAPKEESEWAKAEKRLEEIKKAIAETMDSLRNANLRGPADPNSALCKEFESAKKIMDDAVENHPVIVAKKNEIARLGKERDVVSRKNADLCDLRWAVRKAHAPNYKEKEKELTNEMVAYYEQEKALLKKKADIGAEIEEDRLRLRTEDPEIARLNQIVMDKYANMRNALQSKPEVQTLVAKLSALQKEKLDISRRLPVLRAQTRNTERNNTTDNGSAGKNI